MATKTIAQTAQGRLDKLKGMGQSAKNIKVRQEAERTTEGLKRGFIQPEDPPVVGSSLRDIARVRLSVLKKKR